MLHMQLLTAVWRARPFARYHQQLVGLLQVDPVGAEDLWHDLLDAPRAVETGCATVKPQKKVGKQSIKLGYLQWFTRSLFDCALPSGLPRVHLVISIGNLCQALDLLLAWGHDKQSQLQTPRLVGVRWRNQAVGWHCENPSVASFCWTVLAGASSGVEGGHKLHRQVFSCDLQRT